MTGDGVWPHMSAEIRETLLAPFFDIDWKIHDISLQARDASNDAALTEAIADLKKHKAAVKGPTITPTTEQTAQFGLSKQWASPNGIIRKAINGAAIFRTPISFTGLATNAPWMKDVTIARQAVGGIYGAPNVDIPGGGKLRLIFEDASGNQTELASAKVDKGVAMLTTETDASIIDYAHAIFQQGLAMNKNVLFAAKQTINPVYDGRFHDLLQQIFDAHYADRFAARDLIFKHREADGPVLIDAVVSKIPQGKLNNWIVALRNYDGDVASDQVAGEHISLGMMDSTLVSADGILLADPPHGTASDLDHAWHENGVLLANPAAHIFAYAEAIRHKAELNGQPDVAARAKMIKDAVVKTFEAGHLTGDLTRRNPINGQQFIQAVRATMFDMLKPAPAVEPRLEPTAPGM
jgi:isocitrate dehydrogenase